MLEQLLKELHNWFRVRNDADGKYPGTYTVKEGTIDFPFLQNGQYFRIIGSVFNDGLYIYDSPSIINENHTGIMLRDETFTGSIWALAIPRAVVTLANEVETWVEKYGEAVSSPYSSESFGGYSYTKSGAGTTYASGGGGSGGWQTVFAAKLNPWRKISED